VAPTHGADYSGEGAGTSAKPRRRNAGVVEGRGRGDVGVTCGVLAGAVYTIKRTRGVCAGDEGRGCRVIVRRTGKEVDIWIANEAEGDVAQRKYTLHVKDGLEIEAGELTLKRGKGRS